MMPFFYGSCLYDRKETPFVLKDRIGTIEVNHE